MYKFSALICTIMLCVSANCTVFAEDVTVSGECVGIKVYTDGLIVTDTMDLTDICGKQIDIASGYGIKKGDIITKVNGTAVENAQDISDALSCGQITLSLRRKDKEFDVTITPAKTENGPKLGLWLRDSTAGLGTITCYMGNKFVGLGHGICDIDTGNIMPVRNGLIQECTSIDIIKGKKGSPGAITGAINGKKLGKVSENDFCGIRGTTFSSTDGIRAETADKTEIRTGNASILSDVDGTGVKEYEIEISHISASGGKGKDMVIKIKDKELIEKTGGIVQGMSGSPIMQNGKLVGAVTHVFVNDPTKGYGVFIENMLDGIN